MAPKIRVTHSAVAGLKFNFKTFLESHPDKTFEDVLKLFNERRPTPLFQPATDLLRKRFGDTCEQNRLNSITSQSALTPPQTHPTCLTEELIKSYREDFDTLQKSISNQIFCLKAVVHRFNLTTQQSRQLANTWNITLPDSFSCDSLSV